MDPFATWQLKFDWTMVGILILSIIIDLVRLRKKTARVRMLEILDLVPQALLLCILAADIALALSQPAATAIMRTKIFQVAVACFLVGYPLMWFWRLGKWLARSA